MIRSDGYRPYTGKKPHRWVILVCFFVLAAGVFMTAMSLHPETFPPGRREDSAGKEEPPGLTRELTASLFPGETKKELPLAKLKPPHDFSRPVPERNPVGDDYFDDAVFIGDSRTETLLLYSGPLELHGLTAKGLNVDTIFTKEVILREDGKKLSILEALKGESYKKIYIMLGINELGWVYERIFIERYAQVIDALKETEPGAAIYVQALFPFSQKKSEKDAFENNERIRLYNELILEMAREKEVYYVDVFEAMSDDTGALFADASVDGVHQNKKYSGVWLDYLKSHTVSEE